MTEPKNNDGTSPAGGTDPGRLEKMKERAAERKFSFLYLYNPTQAIGLTYGAKVTLHVFGLDQQRKLTYVGAVDDNMKAADAKTHDLRDALDALLAGKQPPKAETKPVGCVIQYEKKYRNVPRLRSDVRVFGSAHCDGGGFRFASAARCSLNDYIRADGCQ